MTKRGSVAMSVSIQATMISPSRTSTAPLRDGGDCPSVSVQRNRDAQLLRDLSRPTECESITTSWSISGRRDR